MITYRVRCTSTTSGWAWDVATLKFYSAANTQIYPLHAIDSGNAGIGWGPENAITKEGGCDDGRHWGGREDEIGDFWIGGIFSSDNAKDITAVQVVETSPRHGAIDPNDLIFEMKEEDGGCNEWKRVAREEGHRDNPNAHEQIILKRNKEVTANDKKVTWDPTGPIQTEEELTTKPSQPLPGKVHGVCYKSNLHSPRPLLFVPDDTYYYSENCEGLWVCVSKECDEETLQRACHLIRTFVPPEQRKMWGDFVSPTWAKDPGPMRLIVLDDRTNQQAGDIPELRDDSRGRNQTSCPFVFTSREDFYGGIGGGQSCCEGQLTLHEMTHGSDMVIRQRKDPYFHEEVGKLWSRHRDKFRYADSTSRRAITILNSGQHLVDVDETYSFCYAAVNRDEFLAECHCIAQGLHVKSKDYTRCNLSLPGELKEAMPDVFQMLERQFSLKKF